MTALPSALVSTAWLADHLDDPGLRVIEATVFLAPPGGGRSEWSAVGGAEAFAAGHVPGARFADLTGELSAPTGWFTRPEAAALAAAAERLGDFTATATDRYARPGRIPGSLNVPASALLADDGRFLPSGALRERFADVLARPGRTITYCGGGIAASGDAFALHLLGERDVAVYDGSLAEWTADPDLPLEVG